MSISLNQTNFGIRLKKDIGEKLHNFIEQRRGNRNALFNHAIAQYLEGQSNKETSEVYSTSEVSVSCIKPDPCSYYFKNSL